MLCIWANAARSHSCGTEVSREISRARCQRTSVRAVSASLGARWRHQQAKRRARHGATVSSEAKAFMPNRAAAHAALDALIDALAPPAVYTTKGPYPPGRSSAWCKRNFRSIPGCTGKRGLWQVSAADYQRWMTREPTPITLNIQDQATHLLAAAGIRANGRAA